ncbi:uncharacterized protein LOC129279587 [Lytechinus pictus]|uniref:uncharacterized protein LOC129279587 n=1 Tax=Lytechinus pictus TaxID=7653 RepID=UPI0030B9FC96
MAKLVILISLLVIIHVYEAKGISLMQGQEANLIFQYPCDSSEVTLQQSNRRPFYSSIDGSSLSLPANQAQRFEVKKLIINASCSLDLTIKDLMRDDQGTYILFVYKDREILGDHTHRIYLKVHYPPEKALCVVGEDYGRGWVEVDCTADAGSLSGKIECYQNGLWMPHLTDPVVRGSLLKQTILIRKSQPALCCSSAFNVYKSRCECNDTVLFQNEYHGKDPCSNIPITTQISTDHTDMVTFITSMNFTDYHLSTSTYQKKMFKVKTVIIVCALTTAVVVISLIFTIIRGTYMEQKNRNSNVASEHPSALTDVYTDAEECIELNPKQDIPRCSKDLKKFADIHDKKFYKQKVEYIVRTI